MRHGRRSAERFMRLEQTEGDKMKNRMGKVIAIRKTQIAILQGDIKKAVEIAEENGIPAKEFGAIVKDLRKRFPEKFTD